MFYWGSWPELVALSFVEIEVGFERRFSLDRVCIDVGLGLCSELAARATKGEIARVSRHVSCVARTNIRTGGVHLVPIGQVNCVASAPVAN